MLFYICFPTRADIKNEIPSIWHRVKQCADRYITQGYNLDARGDGKPPAPGYITATAFSFRSLSAIRIDGVMPGAAAHQSTAENQKPALVILAIQDNDAQLTVEGAAEYYWGLFIERFQ
jgi:hypothetical protein